MMQKIVKIGDRWVADVNGKLYGCDNFCADWTEMTAFSKEEFATVVREFPQHAGDLEKGSGESISHVRELSSGNPPQNYHQNLYVLILNKNE